MTYTLFYAEKSAAMGVRVLLEEIGLPYELVLTSIDMDTPRPPELLALNPNGWIPVLSRRRFHRIIRIHVFHRLSVNKQVTSKSVFVHNRQNLIINGSNGMIEIEHDWMPG